MMQNKISIPIPPAENIPTSLYGLFFIPVPTPSLISPCLLQQPVFKVLKREQDVVRF